MTPGRSALLAGALACGACGRFGFGGSGGEGSADATERHLRVANGWSIAPLVELTGLVPYNEDDFLDGGTLVRNNEPTYVAALYPPFRGSLAVIAGRSVIEVAADGGTMVHAYRPAVPDAGGPDNPARLTFADLGGGNVGLWMTSASPLGGDGLYRIASDWSITTVDKTNNTYAMTADPTGGYDAKGVAALYVGVQTALARSTGGASTKFTTLPGPVDDVAAIGNALFAVVEDGAQVVLERLDPMPSRLVTRLTSSTSTSLALAEGSTDAGLFAIQDGGALVTISAADGAVVRCAWSDDPDWVWHAVSAPRAGHALAGSLIVLESNRALDRDRLLQLTPALPSP